MRYLNAHQASDAPRWTQERLLRSVKRLAGEGMVDASLLAPVAPKAARRCRLAARLGGAHVIARARQACCRPRRSYGSWRTVRAAASRTAPRCLKAKINPSHLGDLLTRIKEISAGNDYALMASFLNKQKRRPL